MNTATQTLSKDKQLWIAMTCAMDRNNTAVQHLTKAFQNLSVELMSARKETIHVKQELNRQQGLNEVLAVDLVKVQENCSSILQEVLATLPKKWGKQSTKSKMIKVKAQEELEVLNSRAATCITQKLHAELTVHKSLAEEMDELKCSIAMCEAVNRRATQFAGDIGSEVKALREQFDRFCNLEQAQVRRKEDGVKNAITATGLENMTAQLAASQAEVALLKQQKEEDRQMFWKQIKELKDEIKHISVSKAMVEEKWKVLYDQEKEGQAAYRGGRCSVSKAINSSSNSAGKSVERNGGSGGGGGVLKHPTLSTDSDIPSSEHAGPFKCGSRHEKHVTSLPRFQFADPNVLPGSWSKVSLDGAVIPMTVNQFQHGMYGQDLSQLPSSVRWSLSCIVDSSQSTRERCFAGCSDDENPSMEGFLCTDKDFKKLLVQFVASGSDNEIKHCYSDMPVREKTQLISNYNSEIILSASSQTHPALSCFDTVSVLQLNAVSSESLALAK